MTSYQRRLPHWQPEWKALFVTWHLNGSVPRVRYPPPVLSGGKAFVWMDRYLDTAREGPMWLNQPEIALIVKNALYHGAERLAQYELHAWVIMANHVHILISPHVPLPKVTHSIKSFTAREANKMLNRTGEPFWQRESYDHWVRNEAEFDRIARYIENNPVKAGLVSTAEDYPWSSAARAAGKPATQAEGPRHTKGHPTAPG